MANLLQASFVDVSAAGWVRLAELGKEWLRLTACGVDTADLEDAINDLTRGIEQMAQSVVVAEQQEIGAYLIENYALFQAGTDPFLRTVLPPIPATGAEVRRRVRAANGQALGANAKYIASGAYLVPALVPDGDVPTGSSL